MVVRVAQRGEEGGDDGCVERGLGGLALLLWARSKALSRQQGRFHSDVDGQGLGPDVACPKRIPVVVPYFIAYLGQVRPESNIARRFLTNSQPLLSPAPLPSFFSLVERHEFATRAACAL